MDVSKQPDTRHNKSRWIRAAGNVLFKAQDETDSGALLHFYLGMGVGVEWCLLSKTSLVAQ